jgi:CheY-like chemotaxis protein
MTRLLIADSDPTLTRVYHAFFSIKGYDVETVSDGLQCQMALWDHRPDVLILEQDLPWGDADSILESLRRVPHFSSVAVVLITCDFEPERLLQLSAPPVVGCFRKPHSLYDLADFLASRPEPDAPQVVKS